MLTSVSASGTTKYVLWKMSTRKYVSNILFPKFDYSKFSYGWLAQKSLPDVDIARDDQGAEIFENLALKIAFWF